MLEMANILQAHLNRAWRAQDLMLQTVAENDAIMCLVSEPARIPDSPRWYGSGNGLAAVYIGRAAPLGLVSLHKRGVRYVAVSARKILFISCYVSPNVGLPEYRAFLDELSDVIINARNFNILLAGDFNAHSLLWGSGSTSLKGELLGNWAAGLDLRLANLGNAPTCVRWQGSSIIDLTWTSPVYWTGLEIGE